MNHYQILEIPYTATQEQIKKAFRTLAKKYHPDVNKAPNAKEMMQKITEAYEVLSDITKRKEYDKKLNIQANSGNKQSTYHPYSSYTKTKEESEMDLDDWLDEYLKKEREKNKTNIGNINSWQIDTLKSLKRDLELMKKCDSILKILNNDDLDIDINHKIKIKK